MAHPVATHAVVAFPRVRCTRARQTGAPFGARPRWSPSPAEAVDGRLEPLCSIVGELSEAWIAHQVVRVDGRDTGAAVGWLDNHVAWQEKTHGWIKLQRLMREGWVARAEYFERRTIDAELRLVLY